MGWITETVEKNARGGNAFICATGVVNSPIGVGIWRGLLRIPPTHNKKICLYRIDVMTDLPITYLKMIINPTVNLPLVTDNLRIPVNANMSSPNTTPVTLNYVFGTTPMSGGIDPNIALFINTQQVTYHF